ncbi:sugar porter family MFS transporter [Rhodococcus sp. X156]|uniref:sugar porter family MFS transporter n=1 Tax=Rhodococcus sp. X156 TaxID=2499145 RepID=UPI000FD6F861|nr:sugar porter family MFS transporter [Rhodococcus sp. X156]
MSTGATSSTPARSEPPAGGASVAHALLFSLAAALGGFLFGYDTAVINGAVKAIQSRFNAGTAATGLTVSLALIGAALGAWVAGAVAGRLGRLWTMRIAAVLFIVSSVGSALAFSVVDLACWRVVGGVAVGIASVISPAYIAEISPAAYRGRLGSMHQLAIVLGIAVSSLVNYALAEAAGGSRGEIAGLEAWRWMLMAAAFPGALYLLMTYTLPESPRFLVAKGKTAVATKILASLEGGNTEQVDHRIEEIRVSLKLEERSRVRDLFTGQHKMVPLVLLGVALAALQQLVGINVIFYYSASLWQSVGIGEDRSLLISVVSAVVNIVGTFVAIAVIDKIGRRPLLAIGSVGMTVALGIASWCFSHAEAVAASTDGTAAAAELPSPYGTIALVAANGFVFFFALSWGPVVWVLLSEMFPNRSRAAAVAVATSANWIANFAVTVTFPTFSAANLSLTYAGYAAMAAVSLVVVIFFVKETKGRTLEENG